VREIRTAPGKVFRLYSREAFDDMDEDTTPEIQRSSLLGTILSMKAMGIDDILRFDFIDPPASDQVITALKQLYYLGMYSSYYHSLILVILIFKSRCNR
jgi:HrpA-like RNA helicase